MEPVTVSIEERALLKAVAAFEKAFTPQVPYSEDQLETARAAIKDMKNCISLGLDELKNGSYSYWANR